MSYINTYHLFVEHITSYRFLSGKGSAGVLVFGGEMTFSDTEMMELGIKHPTNIYNTRPLICTLKYALDILQTEEALTVEEYTHTHTKHTHTHTHTHTHDFNKKIN